MLNDGSAQSEHDRLNLQHALLDDIMRNDLLPPHIASALSASSTPPKILEIATGTAVWLSDVAKTLSPDAELVGLDFDTSKFPEPSTLAPNISLRQANMFKPFASDLLGQFDVVNVRLIVFALKAGDGIGLAKNIMSLLKPGGHLVWTETSPLLTSIEPPSVAWHKFQQVYWRFATKLGGDLNIPIAMAHYMKEAGYTDTDDRPYVASAQLYTEKRHNWLQRANAQAMNLSAQTIRGIVSLGGIEGAATPDEAAELIAQINEDLGERKIHHTMIRAWGKRPDVST